MSEDKINSDESEGAFNEFIQDTIEELLDDIVNRGGMDRFGDKGSDIIIEMDDIVPPAFVYDNGNGMGQGRGKRPGREGDKIRFNLPFKTFMELLADRLSLPNLLKEGKGKIKQVSYTFKTFGQTGVILDKKRTFKRALKSSVCSGLYDPETGKYSILIKRRDKRYKLPKREEKPKYHAVVFYMGDISYSTYGERLEMEKRIVNFIHHWVDFNYGPENVEHRFFVHDVDAYEVKAEDFYSIANAGGTIAASVFDLVNKIAFNEYVVPATNFYAFYFGDGELFGSDAQDIVRIIDTQLRPLCARIGVVEVKPGTESHLKRALNDKFSSDPIVRVCDIQNRDQTVSVIKTLFGESNAEYKK